MVDVAGDGLDDQDREAMQEAAKQWAAASGDWSPEQWQRVNAALRPAVERARKRTEAKTKAKQSKYGPPTKP